MTSTPTPIPPQTLSAVERRHLDDFIHEGAILNALTAQGVSVIAYGEQLARTKAAFDLMEDDPMISEGNIYWRYKFRKAMKIWVATYRAWTKLGYEGSTGFYPTGEDLTLANETLATMDMPPIKEVPYAPNSKRISKSWLVRKGMGAASEEFWPARQNNHNEHDKA